ncbi:E3 ubiquitin-protein ligase Os04g0590900-like [Musa acuminata AAA Group]|uniref:E3 ubiquitin-protein ligase Os04g0590900-like n=1 Tax=Musa acuminata AAA Group TaxID=214697 RepID=UPI0031DEDF42
MATNDNHPTWVAYEPTKDCSLGFCSFYCPQWCSVIFSPPPPVQFADEGSGRTFSPLVIAVIGILTSAFLIVSYYAIVSKYCGTFSSRRWWWPRPGHGTGTDDDELDSNLGQDGTWHFSPTNGLDEALISKITVCKYKRDDGLIEVTDCAVCLGEFRKDDTLRLLPKCSHAFHVPCIDTWLRSHSNCPLCRANIVPVTSAAPLQLPAPPPQQTENNIPIREGEHEDEVVLVIPDGDEETELPKNPSRIHCSSGEMEDGSTVVGTRDGDLQPIRRSLSMDCSYRDGVSIVELLQMTYASSSRRWGGEHRKNSSSTSGPHGVMSPAPMKRSFSSGRVWLTRQAKGSNSMLPV